MLTNCRLTIAGQVDASSIESIVRDVVASLPPSAGDEDKVLALYRYVREHLFAFIGTQDDLIEPLNKAILTLNWWGFGLCGRQAKTLGILAAHLLGHDNVRTVGMREREVGAWRIGQAGRPYAFVWTPRSRGWKPGGIGGHTSLEIRWGGRWHFLDAMVGFYRRGRDGQIASLQQIIDDPAIADVPVGDARHGDMPYGPEVEIFTRSEVKFHHPGLNAWPGELPPLNLRRGERLTFLPEPLAGEFFIHPKMRAIFEDDVSAGGPREGRPNAPAARYGNAEHTFDVELRPEASDPLWRRETGDWHVPVELPYPITSIHWTMCADGAQPADSRGEGRGEGNGAQPPNSPSPWGEGRGEGNGAQPPSAVSAGDCSGLLFFPPSTGDEIVSISAAGSNRPGPQAPMGRAYRLIVRAPGRRGCVRLRLRTIVQHNPLVQPVLKNGRNVVRLAGNGDGSLVARIDYTLAGEARTVRLAGVGEHEVVVGDGAVTSQSVTLMNE